MYKSKFQLNNQFNINDGYLKYSQSPLNLTKYGNIDVNEMKKL